MQRAHPGEEPSGFLVMIGGKPSGKLQMLYFVPALVDQEQEVNEIFFRQLEEASQSQALVLIGALIMWSIEGNTEGH